MTTTGQHPTQRPMPEGVRCIVCEYELHLQSLGSFCPECGESVGSSVVTDPLTLDTIEWLRARLVRWQVQSALALMMILVIPMAICTGMCMIAYLVIHLRNHGAVVRSQYTARLHSTKPLRPGNDYIWVFATCMIAVVCLTSVFVWQKSEYWKPISMVAAFAAIAPLFVAHAFAVMNLGNALRRVHDELVVSRGGEHLSRADLIMAAASMATAAMPTAVMSTLGLMLDISIAWEVARGLVLCSFILFALGGAIHAAKLFKPRKQIATLVANSRIYHAAR